MNIQNFRLPADFFFIDKVVEPLTQKIQKYFGLDCFFWSKICLWICQICGAVSIVFALLLAFVSLANMNPFWLLISLVTILMQSQLFLCHYIILASQTLGLAQFKRIAYRAVENGERNPLLLFPRSLMFAGVTFTILTFLPPTTSWWGILIDCVWKTPFVLGYFAQCLYSCTPIPPKKSVLRAKIEAAQELFARGFGDDPEPEPA